MDGDEELGNAPIVFDEVGGYIVWVDGLQIVLLNESGNLVFKVTDLEAVGIVAGIDGTDESHDNATEVASGDVHVTLEDVSNRSGGDRSMHCVKGCIETSLSGNLSGKL